MIDQDFRQAAAEMTHDPGSKTIAHNLREYTDISSRSWVAPPDPLGIAPICVILRRQHDSI
jgi:hypothetical protein